MSFSSDIHKWAIKTERRTEEVTRAVKISLFSGVIRDTRVETGRLRGNWQTSTGAPKFTTTMRRDRTGLMAINEAMQNITAYGTDYMTNNLPYAEVWEERDGMIKKNIARIERNLREAVASA